MTTDIANAYQRTQVLTAPPEQLRLMLLEGAVKFARQGLEGIHVGSHEQVFTGFARARDIVVELMTSIRPDTDGLLRSRMQGLYMFIFKQLVDASFEKDAPKAEKAVELLEYEVETWKMALRRAGDERTPAAAEPALRATVSSISVQG